MAAEQGRGIAQDGGLHHLSGMDHAGGQRPDRDGVDADDLVFLVQHGHQEVFAVHGAEVLTEEERGIPGTADLGLLHSDGVFTDQGHPVDGDPIRPGGACGVGGEEAGLLRCR